MTRRGKWWVLIDTLLVTWITASIASGGWADDVTATAVIVPIIYILGLLTGTELVKRG